MVQIQLEPQQMASRTEPLRFTAFLQGGSTLDHNTTITSCRCLTTMDHHPQGSYVAVSGTPGRGSVHVVEGVPALASGSVTVVNGVRVGSKLNVYVGKTFYALSFVVSVLTFVHPFQSVTHHGGTHVAAVPHLPPPLPQVAFIILKSCFLL